MGQNQFHNYHVQRSLPWVDIYIDRYNPRVRLVQKWKYDWKSIYKKESNLHWSEAEKAQFHQSAEKIIRDAWSRKAKLSVTGTSEYAERYRARNVIIHTRIIPVESGQHWTVEVKKEASGRYYSPKMSWGERRIWLNRDSTVDVNHSRGAGKPVYTQNTISHEFGHTLNNVGSHSFPQNLTTQFVDGDEYQSTSNFYNDEKSIMNIGNQIRRRHFKSVVDALNTMIPDTTFEVKNFK